VIHGFVSDRDLSRKAACIRDCSANQHCYIVIGQWTKGDENAARQKR
jgi:hypothetical protein